LTDQDATPDVFFQNVVVTANTLATTITDFDNGYEGQTLLVDINDANTTIAFSGANFSGNGSVDLVAAAGDHLNCVLSGGVWFCQVGLV